MWFLLLTLRVSIESPEKKKMSRVDDDRGFAQIRITEMKTSTIKRTDDWITKTSFDTLEIILTWLLQKGTNIAKSICKYLKCCYLSPFFLS